MAEFKLGRIKFVYQGAWTTGTPYVIDDIVSIGGKTYICVVSHTAAAAFSTDLNHNPTYWNVVADGQNWRGAWTSSTSYQIGDQVQYGGTVYTCNTAHTSATNVSPTWLGLEQDQSKWTVFAKAFSWSGAWATSTKYRVRDIVYYGGITYVCNTAHISASTASSGLENDNSKWDIFNQGFVFQGTWADATRYKLNDVVKYGADLWICTTQHTSSGTLDTGNFQIFVNGFQFENSWSNATTYQVGDVVAYGGYTYIAIQNHSNQTPSTATSYWQPFTTGFKLQGDWASGTSYKVGDVVRLGGSTYVAILDNAVQTVTATETIASTDLTNPNQVVVNDSSKLALNLPIKFSGTTFGGVVSGTQYYVKSIVDGTHITLSTTSGGTTLTLTTGSGSCTGTTNSAPPYSTYWNKLSSGIRWNSTGSTYTNVSGTNIVGTGISATFDVTRVGTSYTAVVHAGSAGSGYAVNDTIKILGSSLGGLTPSNDLILTVASVSSGAVSTVSTSGFAVTWTSGTVYVQGDAVYYGPNTYICITSHVGASGNKPDADTSGAYWNILALGAESASLTTQGDMFYFGNNGPQRLPIGTDGQILRVKNNAPTWSYYGLINNVVYVANTGVDDVGAGRGQTIDKPWKTLRFAAEQVELGHLNVNAYTLLAKNKQFIIKEVNNYIKNILTVSVTNTSNSDNSFTVASTGNLYVGMPISFTGTGGGVTASTTYYVHSIISSTKFAISAAYNGSIFGVSNGGTNTGSYVYDQTKTERDAGILLDAIIYDLGHNGNAQTTTAALAYYSKTSATSYVSGVGAYDIGAFVKAQTYMNTLIGNVLANTAPDANYQTLNGVSSGNRAVQIIDTTLVAETDAAATVASLIAIVSNGISVGSSTAIAAGVNGNTTISAKTGTYNEVLPIVVNKNTAVVGDELRSTVVQPAPANLNLVGDKPKTISALNRIRSLIPNLVSNTSITPTTGNTKTQVTTLPAASTGSTTAITNLVSSANVIYDVVNNGLGTEPSFKLPSPTNYNTSYLVGYGDGKAQIVQNYAFIKDEINSFLTAPGNGFSSMWSSLGATGQAKCLRDVGYILDALQYDMTYGGNFQTLIVGSSYYSNYVSTTASNERAAILGAYSWLKSFIDNIVLKNTAGWVKNSSLNQVVTGTAGSQGAADFAQARIQDIIDWITNGYAPSTVNPDITWTSAALQTSFAALQAKRTEIQADTVAWVKKFFQNINFDSTLCSRDAGIIVDALSYDMVFGSNFNAITAGRSYLRLTTSALTVYGNQKAAELGSIKFISDKSRIIAAAGASAQIQTIIDDVTATIAGGATPRINWPNPSTITSASAASAVLLADNKEFIKAEIQAYLNSTAPYSTVWQSLSAAQQATCTRDVGYIVDALVYDLKYGGSFAIKQAGQAYYSYTTLEIASSEKAAMLASLSRLSTVAQAIIQSNAVSVSTGNTATQVLANGAQAVGNSGSATTLSGLVTIAYNIVNGGLTSGVQTVTITTIATNNTFTTSSTHGLNVGDLVIPQSTANGLTSGTIYYVASTPLTTTFTLSSTYGGTTLASFTNGTGLTIAAEITNEPGTSWVSSTLVAGYTALSTAKSTLQTAVSNYIATNYPTLTYNSATCLRDVGLIIDAVGYDMMLGSNYRSIKSGQSYFRAQAALVVGAQKTATVAAFTYLQSQIYTTLASIPSAQSLANTLMSVVIGIINKGDGVVPEISGTNTYNNTLDIIKGAEILRANADFLAYEAAAWTDATFGGYVTTTAASTNLITTSTPHGFVVGDPVVFTAPTITTTATAVSTNNITVASSTGILPGMPIVFGGNLGNLVLGTTYYVLTSSGGVLTVSSSYNGSAFDAGTASGSVSATAGGTFGGLSTSSTFYVLSVPSTTTFTITTTQSNTSQTVVTLSSANGLMNVKYSYNLASCVRDTKSFINAIVYDLNYTGNYKSNRAAILYNNAVSGSAMSDMWLLRNATGIRNTTMTGLSGGLTNVNSFGTKRPTGGSFSSLDPGFGPNDTSVWIISRSPYTQNCTMFGTAVTGVKIDGALHTGGNKSMVANDYTTIISDGIGAWCTGTGSLTELVSVFNYYGYSGYLAELGGRIRATNGNSSYGTYGVIAEGVDTYETPIYGTVNNRSFQANITNVVTDGINQILRVEYANAGSNYTNSTPTVSGSGYNITTVQDEFRDAGLFESRIIDLNNGQGTGGSYYASVSNTAQAGTTTQITIAATDIALSAAYVGMRVQLIAGTGAGQYANILSYNNGTKVALVTKDSFTPIAATAATQSSDLITVASTASLYANMPIYFGSAISNVSANTLYYVKTISSGTQFTISTSSGGATFDIASDASGQSAPIYAAGWDHCVAGTAISAVLDLSSQYVIEPRISFTNPGYTATARTLSATATWSSVASGDSRFVAIASGGTATSYSTDGKTWTAGGALPVSSTWNSLTYGGGAGATATATVGGLGGSGATFTAVIGTGATATQIVGINVTNGGYGYTTPPVISISGGGGIGATATCTVLNGSIQSVTMTINGSGYNAQPTITTVTDTVTALTPTAWGRNYTTAPTVTISAPFSGSAWAATTGVSLGNYIYYNNSGTINWYLVTGAGTTGAVAPTHTTGAVANGSATLTYAGTTAAGTANLTNGGVSSITINTAGKGYTSTPTVTIVDSTAKFVAIRSGGTPTSAYSSVANLSSAWTNGNALPTGDLASVIYGGGFYVAVGGTSGTASAASSTDGITWVNRSSAITALAGSATYSCVAYGANVFLAVATGSNVTSYSTSGVTWTAGGTLPSSTTWIGVTFGNNRFVAIASSGALAYSINNGSTWVAASIPLSSSYTWSHIEYGQGLFFAIASGTNVCATSPDGINWTYQTLPSSSNWTDVTFGTTKSATLGTMPLWVAISNTSGTVAASVRTGATPLGRIKVVANVVTETRVVEPGSGFPKGNVTATTTSTNVITTDDTTNLIDSQPVIFTGLDSYGLTSGKTYYVIGSTIVSNTSFKVSATAGSATSVNLTTGSTLSGVYRAGPIITQTDPNKVNSANLVPRTGDGVLANPTYVNRGSGNQTATASTIGDGYADLYQPGSFINIAGLFAIPQAGANVEFSSIPGVWYKLVQVTNVLGSAGNYTGQFQISPALTVLNAPEHGSTVTTRLKYSQVRLTGHDFLYIGVGNYTQTNYPNVDASKAIQANQTVNAGGGRVFFTATDQDGNFNVGNLFGVQQATGTATLNASAFNIAGLQSLTLGSVSLGVGSATITSFSTDPYFTANSDNILPTQRAIKSYITSQIGGGLSTLNVNTLTAGVIYIANNTITTTTGGQINVNAKMNFTGGIDGAPVALVWFGQR